MLFKEFEDEDKRFQDVSYLIIHKYSVPH